MGGGSNEVPHMKQRLPGSQRRSEHEVSTTRISNIGKHGISQH